MYFAFCGVNSASALRAFSAGMCEMSVVENTSHCGESFFRSCISR